MPDDWYIALAALAARKGVSLSQLVAEGAAKRLTKEERAQLSAWVRPGRLAKAGNPGK